MNNTNIHIEDLLKEIYENKRIIEEEKNTIIKNSTKAKNLKDEYEKKYEKLKLEEKNILQYAKEQAAKLLIDIKEDADDIIRNIENSKTSKEANEYRKNLNTKINELSVINNENNKKIHLKKEDLSINQEVFIEKLKQNGTIISIGNNSCMIQVGSIKSSFKFEDLSPAQKTDSNKSDITRKIKKEFNPISISPEINVIGQNVDEACFVIDKYLDTCSLNNLNTVRIIHGKGTGRLRTGIHIFLKTHPHVKSFRLGTFGEGEIGVTIVELK